MAVRGACERAAPPLEAQSIPISSQERVLQLPGWREERFPTREDIFIGFLALGVVLAVLFVAATVLTT